MRDAAKRLPHSRAAQSASGDQGETAERSDASGGIK